MNIQLCSGKCNFKYNNSEKKYSSTNFSFQNKINEQKKIICTLNVRCYWKKYFDLQNKWISKLEKTSMYKRFVLLSLRSSMKMLTRGPTLEYLTLFWPWNMHRNIRLKPLKDCLVGLLTENWCHLNSKVKSVGIIAIIGLNTSFLHLQWS